MCDIKYKIKVIFLIIILVATVTVPRLQAQEKPEVIAIQLFDSGKYDAAEALFRKLLEQNPDNPVSQYYYGATRTENQHFSDTEIACLLAAGKNITPDRLNYYLGVQYHAREDWEQALKYYNLYRISVPREEQDEVELAKKIQLCFNHENPFGSVSNTNRIGGADTGSEALPENSMPEPIQDTVMKAITDFPGDFTADNSGEGNISGLFVPREALPNLPNVETVLPGEELVDFQVNNSITYQFPSQFQTEEGLKLFEKAQTLKAEQENAMKEADRLRTVYKTSGTDEKKRAVASEILELEQKTYQLEEEKRNAYVASRQAENEYWEQAGPVSRNNFLMEQEKILEALQKEEPAKEEPDTDFLIDFIEPEPKSASQPQSDELIYKIQIGAYSKGVPAYKQRLYKKLSVIRTIENYTDDKGIVVYTTGNLSRLDDAQKMRAQVKQEGIEDAQVVPYFNGKRITLEQAKEIEAQNDI